MHQPSLKRAASALALGVAVAGSVAIPAGSASAGTVPAGKAGTNGQYAANLAAVKTATAGHTYRHGVEPTQGTTSAAKKALADSDSPGDTFTFDGKLHYYGGTDGVGVQTSTPKVYIVYIGSQWGTASTSGSDTVFSADPAGMAKAQQDFFRGIGSNGEKWSNVATQYCQGVALNATSCPPTAQHLAASTGGVLAGVWYDNAAVVPDSLTAVQIGQEAIAAAAHFNNTTSASNKNAQYIITFPTGTHPDGWDGSFCAWHDYTGDPSLGAGESASPYGDIAFTNMPYLPDQGANCGANFVNAGAAGTLDGVSIVGGHEFVETQSDPFPNSNAGSTTVNSAGWLTPITDVTTNQPAGLDESADLCAWISPKFTGGAKDLSLSTGTFPVQGIWSNSDSNCETAVQTVDFNSDMLTDIAGIDANNDMKLYTGNGASQLSDGGYMWPKGGGWGGFKLLTAGDFNGDGITDIAGIDANNDLKLYLGDGKGHLVDGGYMWPKGGGWGGFKQIVAGDFQGKGTIDIAGIDANNDLKLYVNNGHGQLSDGGYMWPKGGGWGGFKEIVAGDFNGDGITDIAGIDANHDLKGYLGAGDGTLTGDSWYMWPQGGLWNGFKQIVAGDFNSDNITDIVGIDANNDLKLYKGVGDGTLVDGGYMWPKGGGWAGFKRIV